MAKQTGESDGRGGEGLDGVLRGCRLQWRAYDKGESCEIRKREVVGRLARLFFGVATDFILMQYCGGASRGLIF